MAWLAHTITSRADVVTASSQVQVGDGVAAARAGDRPSHCPYLGRFLNRMVKLSTRSYRLVPVDLRVRHPAGIAPEGDGLP